MRILTFSLITILSSCALGGASDTDAELEEKLKAVMILFNKSHQGLNEEIESLELQVSYLETENEDLEADLETARQEILDLKTTLLLQESESGSAGLATDVVAAELIASNSNFGNANQGGARGGQRGRAAGGGGRQMEVNQEAGSPAGGLLDVNSAARDELLSLPLVNEFLADAIIDGRPWGTMEDLIQLQGFGPMKLRRLQPFATALPMSEITEESPSENPIDLP